MKRRALLLTLALTISIAFIAQSIPNPSFESWSITNGWTEEPDGWNTPNNQLIETTVKDLDPYQGDFAMRVNPYNMGAGEYGWANVDFPSTVIPPSLNFYAKWEKTSTAAVGVDITFWDEDIPIYTASWFPEENQSTWTLIQIPLNQIEPIMDHVTINVFVSIGDLVAGEGWISVDDFSFGLADDLGENAELSISIYPNPSNEFIVIENASELPADQIRIIDMNGKVVQSLPFQKQVEIQSLAVGNYFMELSSRGGLLGRERFLVER